ncbi:hypothetical protein ACFWPX_20430 [Nocardia sp. NPDC058518]|uniref:hypothetical protein n=1 Tax=Nocardia sp. NPDC058518 TaxID=3346534 RepID=UPI003647B0C9
MDYWNGIVQRIFYRIQFEPDLNEELASRIANALLVEPIETLTAAEEYTALTDGLRRQAPLPSLVPMRQPPTELRNFLLRVVEGMDSMRPWPTPPYVELPVDDLSNFQNFRPIARLALSVNEVEGRISRIFNRDSEDGPFLLLRLNSGATVGFFSPYWEGSDDVLVASGSADRDPVEVLRELTDTDRLEPEIIFHIDSNDAPPSPLSTRYETTPILPPFRGEHLAGNDVWEGKQVEYLDDNKRRDFRLFGYNGLLHNSKGDLFDTASAQTLWTPQGGRAIFAMDKDGYLYSAPYHIIGEFHHSSFLAGQPVAGAGEIAASQGKIVLISDHSTHYQPARKYTRQVVDSLRRQGVAVADNQIEYHYAD